MVLKSLTCCLCIGVLLHFTSAEPVPVPRRIPLSTLEAAFEQQLEAASRGEAIPPPPYISNFACDRTAKFRRLDGICNNIDVNPLWGAAETPQPRLLTVNRYQDGIDRPTEALFSSSNPLPTARAVTLSVHLTNSNVSNNHSLLLMNFGQFLDHDLILTPVANAPFQEGGTGLPEQCCSANRATFREFGECFPIFTPNDPIFTRTCIPFLRSDPAPGLPNQQFLRYQLNDVTSFLDGSQVYGVSEGQTSTLRSLQGGRFLVVNVLGQESLPPVPNNPATCFSGPASCRFLAGDIRVDEQAALASVHALLVREHNRLADGLSALNPLWDDERLFQEARKIVGALLQCIYYNEWIPIVLGRTIMRKYALTLLKKDRFTGYNPKTNAAVTNEFGASAFRFGHSLIRQDFRVSNTQSIDLEQVFEVFATVRTFGDDGFLNGMTTDTVEILDKMITTGVRDRLFGLELDLPALNIQRGRDHGIGSYFDHRRRFNLPVFDNYNQMIGVTHTMATINALRAVYPNPADIELFPGGLSEIPLQDGMLGPTFSNIIGLTFQRLRFGDRFWFETNDRNAGFSDDQLAQIRKYTIAQLFCENVRDVQVRRWLFNGPSVDNPVVPCRDINSIDLRPWQENRRPTRTPNPNNRRQPNRRRPNRRQPNRRQPNRRQPNRRQPNRRQPNRRQPNRRQANGRGRQGRPRG